MDIKGVIVKTLARIGQGLLILVTVAIWAIIIVALFEGML